jgi:predicted amidohydrolase
VNFTVNGAKCSLLICFDARFPELYRKLYKQGVNFVLQSFYNARQKGPSVHTRIIRQTMQCRAATNYFWVSMANSSACYSPYPSCFIQPDGVIVKQLRLNRAGMMVNTMWLLAENSTMHRKLLQTRGQKIRAGFRRKRSQVKPKQNDGNGEDETGQHRLDSARS